MDIQQLMTLCSVVAEGNMTAAAARLDLTQPAVSQQVRGLEKELGIQILVRGVRESRLTVQGQLMYNYARKVLHSTQQLQMAIQTLSNDMDGGIQVATLSSIGLYLITPIIGTILNPGQSKLRMGLAYGTGTEIIEKMKKSELDIAILPHLQEEYGITIPGYESEFLCKDELLFVGSGKDGSLPNKLSVKELNIRPTVNFQNLYPKFRSHVDQVMEKHQVSNRPIFESNNIGTLKRFIEVWMCCGFLPFHSIHKQIRMKRLSVIQVEEIKYSMNIHVYYPKQRDEKKQKIITTFLMMLKKHHHLI